MAGHRRTERELADALIEGVAPPPHGELAGVAAFLEQLPAVAREPVRSELEDRHIAAMSAAYRVLDAPVVTARKPFPLRPRPAHALRSATVKTAVVCLVLFSVGGALAATGNLPAIQDQVADAVNSIVDLPGGSDDDSADIEKGATSTTDDGATGTQGRDASNGTREDGQPSDETGGSADARVTSRSEGSTHSTETFDEATDEPEVDDGTPDPTEEPDATDEPDTDDGSPDTPEEESGL